MTTYLEQKIIKFGHGETLPLYAGEDIKYVVDYHIGATFEGDQFEIVKRKTPMYKDLSGGSSPISSEMVETTLETWVSNGIELLKI